MWLLLQGSRSAVGGCISPGNRVDPWWNSGSFCSSVSGPTNIYEGTSNNGYQSYNLQNRISSTLNLNQHRQSHQQTQQYNQSNFVKFVEPGLAPGCTFIDSKCLNPVKPGNLYSIISNSSQTCLNSTNNQILSTLLGSSPLPVTENPHSTRSILSPGHSNVISSLLSSSYTSSKNSSSLLNFESSTHDSSNSLNNIKLINVKINPEDSAKNSIENRIIDTISTSSCSLPFRTSLLSSLLSTSELQNKIKAEENNLFYSKNTNSKYISTEENQFDQEICSIKVKYSSLSANLLNIDEKDLIYTASYDTVSISNKNLQKAIHCKTSDTLEKKNFSCNVLSPTFGSINEMKYETQPTPPNAPSHLTSSGIEPPHSSQGSGVTVGGSPAEIVGVESLLLSPWNGSGTDFIETSDVKQTSADLQDAWDTLLLGSSVSAASAQSLAELKPLPPFTGYTGHLSINGIPGHHYHAIASSAHRPPQQSSPTPSSNQEYYEAPVVSSSTPCPQGNQKQQLQQTTQQVDYDIEDIAQIIGSAIADTTVPGGGNGPGSENDPDASRDWIDIAEWIDTACSPKAQDHNSPSPYSQIYTTSTPSNQAQQHSSTLQSLLTHGYAPLLQARLQSGNTAIQNASCGETPSSTSPYPPVSPPGRVSTSCSPDHLLHSSFATPSHPRKRSRQNSGTQNLSKKNLSTGTPLSYGTESSLIGGKEKPVHRCSICNRGFLNKSNIKVHLRTHTGEKPFRCEVCGKAFRQKAHLIKHQQIHKRIGRD